MSKAVKLTQEKEFILPPVLIGRIDVSRLLQELETVDNDLQAQYIRSPQKSPIIPAMSKTLGETIVLNHIDILKLDSRKELMKALRTIKEKAPIAHISFAVDAQPDVTAYLVGWMRQALHPHVLVTVGLQPDMVGGCIIRTPDHIYDFSLRKRFKQQQQALADQIHTVAQQVVAVQPDQTAQTGGVQANG